MRQTAAWLRGRRAEPDPLSSADFGPAAQRSRFVRLCYKNWPFVSSGLIDEAGTSPIPGLPRYAATVAGRGITLAVMVQDHNQLEHVYGKYGARSLINNMETQLYYRQSGLETSEYIEKRMGRKSEYAHSKTMHGSEEAAEGESEQAVSLMTVQDITELSETEIIGIHRNLKPFRAKRMDWRQFPHLVARTEIAPPVLPTLPPAPEIAPLQHQESTVFDLDG
jgi:type IV secretory pathway TraG/TraD family ATPase VirD4